jgi:hypothetical protein
VADQPNRPPTRRQRRAYLAGRRRQEKRELAHACACARSARAAGVPESADLGVGILFFHDLHRALGEPSCPRCVECIALKREGRIDRARPGAPRAEVLENWRRLLAAQRAEVPDGAR